MSSTAAAVLAQIPHHRTARYSAPAIDRAAGAITLRTVPPAIAGAPCSFQVIDTRQGRRMATLLWREFAHDFGWQCRLPDDRRTLRKCYLSIVDALVEQGGFRRDDARAAVDGNAEAMAEETL